MISAECLSLDSPLLPIFFLRPLKKWIGAEGGGWSMKHSYHLQWLWNEMEELSRNNNRGRTLGFLQWKRGSSSSSSIPSPWGTLGHHRWFCNQFSPFFPVLHCPLGLTELQACPFPDVVFPPLPLSALSSSPFHCAFQDGFGQTWWMGNMTIPLQFVSLYKQVDRMQSSLSRQSAIRSGRLKNGHHCGPSP